MSICLDTIKPHLTPDFVGAFKALGKQVGYRNLGRAIAYAKLPTATAVKELSVTAATPEPSITPRGSLGNLERPKKGPMWMRAFTPCVDHAKEASIGLSVTWTEYQVRQLLEQCGACKEWTTRHARIMAEEMVNRNGQKPHYKGKWWYQNPCPHEYMWKQGDCEKCNKIRLAEWTASSRHSK